ncbi:MAG: hypothetical protein GJ680_18970 [Alteromonadaceae bacterium]|nr:hypothetical protein [Alteromonadaceae bacterium]
MSISYSYRIWTSILIAYLGLQLLALFYAVEQESNYLEKSIEKVNTRIALDLPELRIANEIFNQAADENSVSYYAKNLNAFLEKSGYPVRLAAIQNIAFDVPAGDVRTVTLNTSRQEIEIKLAVLALTMQWRVILIPLLFASIFASITLYNVKITSAIRATRAIEEKPKGVKLVIDLRDRTLYLNSDDTLRSTLSNKPLCFYLAMLKFCRDNDKAILYHNKDLPEDFVELANKYFYRLLELGHSRRKRPDFDSNIDKMLSEIRAALDEIFTSDLELKKVFYPQKAQGEGSRSKLHNYALVGLKADQYELIGH